MRRNRGAQDEPAQGGEDPVPAGRAMLYGLANLAYFLGYSTFNTYVLLFYTEERHVPAHVIGRAWLVFGIWNTVNDFLCGWLSDRVPQRLGSRSFPVLLLSVPIGISFHHALEPALRTGRRRAGGVFPDPHQSL